MANDIGYFSKMGLDISMKIFMDGALVVAPMLSGEVEIGVMTPNAGFFNSIYRGGPFRTFLCNGQGRPGRAVTAVVIRSDHYDAGVKTLPDLAKMQGKTAAVGAAGSINQYGLGLRPQACWSRSCARRAMADSGSSARHRQAAWAEAGRCRRNHLPSRLSRAKAGLLPDLAVTRRNPARLTSGDQTVRDDMLQRRRETVVRYAMACIHAGRLFNQVAGDPDKHADMLKLIVKSIFPRDEELLKAVAPHWEWIAEDGMPNVASIMAAAGFLGGYLHDGRTESTAGPRYRRQHRNGGCAAAHAEKPFG